MSDLRKRKFDAQEAAQDSANSATVTHSSAESATDDAAAIAQLRVQQANAVRKQLNEQVDARAIHMKQLFMIETEGNVLAQDAVDGRLNAAVRLHNAQTNFLNADLTQIEPENRMMSPLELVVADKAKRRNVNRVPLVFAAGKSLPQVTVPKVRERASGASVDLVARGRQDAAILLRASHLQRTGAWAPRLQNAPSEPLRNKTHWDHLLEEMQWMAADFDGERKWKRALARQVAQLIDGYFVSKEAQVRRREVARRARLRRVASEMARGVRRFWRHTGKLVDYKQQAKLEKHKQEQAFERNLDFLVDQTANYSNVIETNNKNNNNNNDDDCDDEEEDDLSLSWSEEDTNDDDDDVDVVDDDDKLRRRKKLKTLPESEQLQLEATATANDDAVPQSSAKRRRKETQPADKEIESNAERVAAMMREASALQPRDVLSDEASLTVKVPSLLRGGTLRAYQRVGLQWLASMCDKNLNGVLADEMGLGKTIETIALLAWLACERSNWGPHLIVVPTSEMLSWQRELARWCPALKLVSYCGSIKERAALRRGWCKPDAFHVCVTTYKLAMQDAPVFHRRAWQCVVLDELQNVCTVKPQQWQTLLNFNAAHRLLLLSGAPLQHNATQLWPLLNFLMPRAFRSRSEFEAWCAANGHTDDAESQLQTVLRPFQLRRLKRDVETQLPKVEHSVAYCSLSRRQHVLYENFMARIDDNNNNNNNNNNNKNNDNQLIDVLMQLRRVCNHPDLCAPRTTRSPLHWPSPVLDVPAELLLARECAAPPPPPLPFARLVAELRGDQRVERAWQPLMCEPAAAGAVPLAASVRALQQRRAAWRETLTAQQQRVNEQRLRQQPMYGERLRALLRMPPRREPLITVLDDTRQVQRDNSRLGRVVAQRSCVGLTRLVKDRAQRLDSSRGLIARSAVLVARVRSSGAQWLCAAANGERGGSHSTSAAQRALAAEAALLRPVSVLQQVECPDRRLVQFDCGKLRVLTELLRERRAGGHRVILFTQMTRMLDVLEQFLRLHGWTHARLDGASSVRERQALVDRFNRDKRLFVFIVSTRAGCVDVHLSGADTVVFYDSDWNAAMDAQALDCAHRIGQARDVHIYRLVTRRTVEENIFRDARRQDGGGHLAAEFFERVDLRRLLLNEQQKQSSKLARDADDWQQASAAAEDKSDARALRSARRQLRALAAEYVDPAQAPRGASALRLTRRGESGAERATGHDAADLSDAEQLDNALPDRVRQALDERLSGVQKFAVRFLECVEPTRDFAAEYRRREQQVRQVEQQWKAVAERAEKQAVQCRDNVRLFYGAPRQPVVAMRVLLDYTFTPTHPLMDERRAPAPRDFLADCLFGARLFSVSALGGFALESGRQRRAARRRTLALEEARRKDASLAMRVKANGGDAGGAVTSPKASIKATKAEKRARREQRRLEREQAAREEIARNRLLESTLPWRDYEDAHLLHLVKKYGATWCFVSNVISNLPGAIHRSQRQCADRHFVLESAKTRKKKQKEKELALVYQQREAILQTRQRAAFGTMQRLMSAKRAMVIGKMQSRSPSGAVVMQRLFGEAYEKRSATILPSEALQIGRKHAAAERQRLLAAREERKRKAAKLAAKGGGKQTTK